MPNYDVECATCGIYERFKLMADRKDPCDKCGGPIDVLISSSAKTKGFDSYWDDGLGIEVTGQGHRKQVMRQIGADFRDHPSPGDISARRDKMRDRQNREAASR